jgi:cell division protein ZapD
MSEAVMNESAGTSALAAVVYEQPLNERMRAFLRLEHLFDAIRHHLAGADEWSSRAALEGIIDVLSLVSRIDLKSEIAKELERQVATLMALRRDPRVDASLLDDALENMRSALQQVKGSDNAIGSDLKAQELLNAVRQRVSIPAGTCDFDIPAYGFWLRGDISQRQHDLQQWLGTFRHAENAIRLCLSLVRESASATEQTASNGFFQKTLEGSNPFQLIRVTLAPHAPYFTEISAGKHRFTIRFMQSDGADSRPAQADHDVVFKLHCCAL